MLKIARNCSKLFGGELNFSVVKWRVEGLTGTLRLFGERRSERHGAAVKALGERAGEGGVPGLVVSASKAVHGGVDEIQEALKVIIERKF
eukprot:1176300-Prorocentrum_minimum.AAC.3